MKKILKFIKELFIRCEYPIRYKTMSHRGRIFIDRLSDTKEGRDYLLGK